MELKKKVNESVLYHLKNNELLIEYSKWFILGFALCLE